MAAEKNSADVIELLISMGGDVKTTGWVSTVPNLAYDISINPFYCDTYFMN